MTRVTSKRIRLAAATAMAAMLASGMAAPAQAQAPAGCEQPNILFIMSDDHPWTHYGFMRQLHRNEEDDGATERYLYQRRRENTKFPDFVESPLGGPTLATPGLDRLASGGVVFPFGHAGSSVCKPSFQSTLTARWDWHFMAGRQRRGPGVYPYFMPEFMEVARDLADPLGTTLKRYRTLGYGKIWTSPVRKNLGYYESGFDCAWRPASRRLRRMDIQPLLDFIDGTMEFDPVTGEFGPDESGFFGCRHLSTCDVDMEHCRSANGTGPDTWATELSDPGNPASPRNMSDTNRPWMAWYSPSAPHKPVNGRGLLRNAERHYTRPVSERNCKKYPARCRIPVIPSTDNGGNYVGSRLEELYGISQLLTAGERGYIANIMMLDYWIDQIQAHLENVTDPRCGRPMSETTLMVYQSDNGWNIPDSKLQPLENGQRSPFLFQLGDPATGSGQIRLDQNAGHMIHATDVVPTLVDYATNGQACFRSCDISQGEHPVDRVIPVLGADCDPIAPPPGNGNGCLGGKTVRPALEGVIPSHLWRRWMHSVAANPKSSNTQARRYDHLKVHGHVRCKESNLGGCFVHAVDLTTDPDSRKRDRLRRCPEAREYFGCVLKQFGHDTALNCDADHNAADCCGSGVACSDYYPFQ